MVSINHAWGDGIHVDLVRNRSSRIRRLLRNDRGLRRAHEQEGFPNESARLTARILMILPPWPQSIHVLGDGL